MIERSVCSNAISILDNRRSRDRPRVAVLIPCFNAERDIPRALASIADSMQHDVILVDDGSARALSEMLAPIPPNSVVIRMEQNRGIVTALNTGLRFVAAEGYEYAARLDADDWSTPDRLAKQALFLDANPHISLLGAWANVVDQEGNLLFRSEPSADASRLKRSLEYRNPIVHSTFMLRVKEVVAAGGYDRKFQGSEDYELIRRMALSNAVAVIPEALTYFQITAGGISSRRIAQVMSHTRVKLRYYSPLSIHCTLGLIKTALSVGISRRWILCANRSISKLGRLLERQSPSGGHP